MKTFLKKLFLILSVVSVLCSSLLLYSCIGNGEDVDTVKWHYGEEKPTTKVSAELGDFYLDFKKCDVYTFTAEGWKRLYTLKGSAGESGEDGTDAATWLTGKKKPSATDGKNGDYWLNTTTLTVYEKVDDVWSYVTRLTDNNRAYPYDYKNDEDGLKILCIGNSYSRNTTTYAHQILYDLGITNFKVGHLYIANCSVIEHYNNLTGIHNSKPERESYHYFVATGDMVRDEKNRDVYNDYLLLDALQSEDWDFVLFQHVSDGYFRNEEEAEYFEMLVDEVRKYQPNAVFAWNMTWADSIKNDDADAQIAFYQDKIVAKTQQYVVPNEEITIISPIGTAIQNARTSSLGDTLHAGATGEGGNHLNASTGCYTAALTFVGAITGLDVSDVTWRPDGENAVSANEQKIAIESAINALKKPFEVTESNYK